MPPLENILKDFNENMKEVSLLLKFSSQHQGDAVKHALFNKLCIVLLTGKLEAFSELLVEQFAYVINLQRLHAHIIPLKIRTASAGHQAKDINPEKITSKKSKAASQYIHKLLFTNDRITELKLDSSFSYGKHGTSQFRKLYQRIGIQDVFQDCRVYYYHDDLAAGRRYRKYYDIKSIIDALTHMRNSILHGNANPNVSHATLVSNQTALVRFFKQIIKLLTSNLSDMGIN